MASHIIDGLKINEEEVYICLNCDKPRCTGNYPLCQNGSEARMQTDRLRRLKQGEATLFVSLLARMGFNRRQMRMICNAQRCTIDGLMTYAKRRGLVSDEEFLNTTKAARTNLTTEYR